MLLVTHGNCGRARVSGSYLELGTAAQLICGRSHHRSPWHTSASLQSRDWAQGAKRSPIPTASKMMFLRHPGFHVALPSFLHFLLDHRLRAGHFPWPWPKGSLQKRTSSLFLGEVEFSKWEFPYVLEGFLKDTNQSEHDIFPVKVSFHF